MTNNRYRSPTQRMDLRTGYLMVIPSLVALAIFVYVPLFMALEKSFTNWNFYSGSEWIGLRNFEMVLQNQLFRKSLVNILWFVLMIIPVQMLITFLFAHVLKGMSHHAGAFAKTAVYVPTVISGIVASVIFLFIFNYQGGIINFLVRQMGMKRIAFFANPWLARAIIALTSIWMGFGSLSLVMYAGLMNIPKAYYEAAEVDGANTLQKFLRITIPSMKNVFILVAINLTTGTLQMFDLPYLMTGGNPVNNTLTPMMYIYNNFKSADYSMGYTVAAALLMMVVIGTLSSFVFRLIRSEKSMDE
ncbi:MAG: carbohydrate ABC transporter permease [Christensenellales bacterium]|jgi:multiple sugar transport system permease protein